MVHPANPMALPGIGALIEQQAMDEIRDYLAKIDEKVDDVPRAQKERGAREHDRRGPGYQGGMTIREHVDRVNEVAWGEALAVAQAQAYALLQLNDLADNVEDKTKLADLAKTTKEVESALLEWLTVLAYCFRRLTNTGKDTVA